jgi:leucyl aminopeptidase
VQPIVRVSFTDQSGETADADTIAVGLYSTEAGAKPATSAQIPPEASQLVASGEARGSHRSLALAHSGGRRWLLVGLGRREQLTAERVRVAAALARRRARELSTRTLCWQAPAAGKGKFAEEIAAAIVEGTILADYRFERHKSPPRGREGEAEPPSHLDALIVSAPADLARAVRDAAIVADAVNAARDLQNRPANDLTPTALAEEARSLAAQIEGLTAEVEGREGLLARGMGAFAAVAQGSAQEPALITLRYEPPQDAEAGAAEDAPDGSGGAGRAGGTGGGGRADGSGGAGRAGGTGGGGRAGGTGGGGRAGGMPILAIVGKAVTFDSGGISIKPGPKMSEMKFDMSGGAATLQAIAAIARLRLPLRVIAVIGATENLPSGAAVKPGDIVTAANGKTIEINNTDAEGRLVLADCLCHAVSLGARRIVDLATLTGAVTVALGSTYAGLIANDEELAERVQEAGAASGEIVWRLPLHEEYEELIKGAYADLDNAPEARKAGTIVGGTFLSQFVADVPWAHLDIAGSAWDLGRAYAEKHASGYGVRLLVQLARFYC